MFEKNSINLFNENIVYIKNKEADSNEKPNVIFLHGYGDSSVRAKRLFINESKNAFNIYGIDLPGFGESTCNNNPISINFFVKVVESFIKKILNNKSVFIVGHSMGTIVALNLSIANIKWKFLLAPVVPLENIDQKNIQHLRNLFIPKTINDAVKAHLSLLTPDKQNNETKNRIKNLILSQENKESLLKANKKFECFVDNEILNVDFIHNFVEAKLRSEKNYSIIYGSLDLITKAKDIEVVIKKYNPENYLFANSGHALLAGHQREIIKIIEEKIKEN
ncbi:alpha/beta fold hydrolase [Mycoplasma sp. Mirounga ES2805-ORL]|uniref:alpha/beta fold hydrolase n=1 Tax=Mycoplasma sp. Mirounga ES2805-ORL TaxID=754514 RepID=UPI00197BF227|nr:alpha/beta fold hydrolase [Mycoplasma sp. Mirounga ES2805-ORL]QSF13513.1 alpha/beta fold hydrolase [Mycoplasma sp. Mirounga ES2805-ORL]